MHAYALRLSILACLLLGAARAEIRPGSMMTGPTLPPCPDTPNCVSSLETRDGFRVEPLRYQGPMEAAKTRLLEVLSGFSRAQVREDAGTHVWATFTSFLFRFTDDMEFLIDDGNKLIHMRSASRIGYSDLGTNRRRCETIRERFER